MHETSDAITTTATFNQPDGGDRPGINHGIIWASRPGLQRDFVERVPGGFHIDLFPDFLGAQIVQGQRVGKDLGDGLDGEALIHIAGRVLLAVDRGQRDAEMVWIWVGH